MNRLRLWALATSLALAASRAAALPLETTCVVPAKPAGGFDLTCRLGQAMLADVTALRLTY
jgi:tripartite-type tricarboxylate transporter receptor subunit TctC